MVHEAMKEGDGHHKARFDRISQRISTGGIGKSQTRMVERNILTSSLEKDILERAPDSGQPKQYGRKLHFCRLKYDGVGVMHQLLEGSGGKRKTISWRKEG